MRALVVQHLLAPTTRYAPSRLKGASPTRFSGLFWAYVEKHPFLGVFLAFLEKNVFFALLISELIALLKS